MILSCADVIFGIFDASILPALYSFDYFCKDLCLFFLNGRDMPCI